MGSEVQWTDAEFEVDTADARLDLDVIHQYLTGSYWASGVTREVVAASLQGSINFGLYRDSEQLGFARAVTDRATFAYLCDVFIVDDWRGRGLGTFLGRCVLAHPDLQRLRRWLLITRDAQTFYQTLGFEVVGPAGRFMELLPGAAEAGRFVE